MNTEAGKPYHHGDLHHALLTATERLIRQRGVEQVSLRAIARAAGVSHAAPYHHFTDLEDLLAHVAARGFTRLRNAMLLPDPAEDATPLQRLQRAGIAYVRFAAGNPELYRLMFSDRLRASRDHPALASASTAAYEALAELLAGRGEGAAGPEAGAAVPERHDLSDPGAKAHAAWSLVHGLAMLLIDGRLDVDPEDTEQVETVAREVTAVLGPGLRNSRADD